MDSLLMLTKCYPFGTGEAFIENEIQILSRRFKKITIIASEVPTEEKNIREVPQNVFVKRINKKKNTIQRMIDGVKGIVNFLNMEECMVREFKKCSNLTQKLFLIQFEQKSVRIFDEILKKSYLDELQDEKTVLYSYWFFTTARVGIMIKEIIPNNIIYSCCRAHGYDLNEYINPISYLPYRELFLSEYNNIYPCSNNGSTHLINKYPMYSENIKTANLGTIDYGLNYCSNDDIFRIVSCSRLVKIKRVDRIATALSILDDLDAKIEWTHIGGGEQLNKIKNLCKDFKKIKVNFLGDLANREVLGFYKRYSVDLFLNVSSTEGLPVSIMEAISFGIPVLATDVGGTPEIVINGESGLLISASFSDKELAQSITSIMEQKESDQYENLRISSRNLWEEKFNAENNYEKFYTMISSTTIK